jgi:hypothetical protein
MVATWVLIGLIISGIAVSTLGAYFSIVGIGALFSGALIAVWAMAASLELLTSTKNGKACISFLKHISFLQS